MGGSWEDDFAGVASQVEATEPCYILYRLDSTNNLGFEWVLFTYVPDKAKVRQKMVYSSTKASLKMSLGGGRFCQEIHATTAVRTRSPSVQIPLPLIFFHLPCPQSTFHPFEAQQKAFYFLR